MNSKGVLKKLIHALINGNSPPNLETFARQNAATQGTVLICEQLQLNAREVISVMARRLHNFSFEHGVQTDGAVLALFVT